MDWRNVQEIKAGITEMIDKPVDTKQMISNYSWDNIANMYVEMYKAICHK